MVLRTPRSREKATLTRCRRAQVACEDLATAIKDREVSGLRNKHVAALQEEMGLNATGEEEAQV